MKPDATAATPRRDGVFAERGHQVTRLEAFVDAAFAFAVTLLVISLDAIPDSLPALLAAMKGVPAFALSFAMIALIWYAHASWSRRYGLDDAFSTITSLVLVFLVLVYVYPLKILFSTFFAWISAGWLPSSMQLGHYADVRTMFMIYGVAFATVSTCIAALYAHAWRLRARIGLSTEEAVLTAERIAAWTLSIAVAGISILIASTLGDRPRRWMEGAPGMVYFLLWGTRLVSSRVGARVRRRLLQAPA